MIGTILLAAAAFASTNVDDAFLLLAFFADARIRGRDVILGQYLGMAALTLAALAVSLLAYVLPGRLIGWMGVLPILIGLLRLVSAWRRRNEVEVEPVKAGALGGVAAVAAVTIANGGDNIAVYAPLFAGASLPAALAIGAVFAALTGVWCLAAHGLVRHPVLGGAVRTWGGRITPVVLIGLGVYILLRSGAL